MFLRQISTYPLPSICVSDLVSMSPFIIRIISTPSLSVQHDFFRLWALGPKVLFLQMWVYPSSLVSSCTPSVAVSGSQNLSLGVLDTKAVSLREPWELLQLQSCACHPVCFSFSTQALWLPSKNWSLLPSSLHLLSHWLCHSSHEGRGCHRSVSITGSSMGIQIWGPTRTFGKVMFLTQL